MTMTALPDPPQTSDPANFQTKADALIAALPRFVTEANALGTPGLGGGQMTGFLDFAPIVNIAAAATTSDIAAAASNIVGLTGTGGPITAFPNPAANLSGCMRIVKHTGIHTLTNGANLILRGGKDIATAAGDISMFLYEGSSVWRQIYFSRAVGVAGFIANRLTNQSITTGTSAKMQFNNIIRNDGSNYDGVTNFRFTPPPGVYRAHLSGYANPGTSGETCQASIYKNGSVLASGTGYFATAGTTDAPSVAHTVTEMNGTDYLEGFLYVPNGSTALIGNANKNFFSIFKERDL